MGTTTATVPWAAFEQLTTRPANQPLQGDRACPLSGSRDTQPLFSIDDFQFFEDQGGRNRVTHRVVWNAQSGLLYTNPCYTPYGMATLFEKSGQSYVHNPQTVVRQVQWIVDQCPGMASVCDIGCNEGDVLAQLPDHLRKVGVDIDAHSLARARERHPHMQFYCQDLATGSIAESADVLMLLDVLEHLPRPLETLQSLRNMAHGQTRLVIEVPLLDLAFNASQGDIVGFFSIYHLTHFTRRTLEAMLNTAGWYINVAEEMTGYNGYRVVCRPGEAQVVTLSEAQKQAVLQQAQDYVALWHRNHQAVNARLQNLPQRPILIWGAGQHTEYLVHFTNLFQQPGRQFVLIDSDPLKTGMRTHGILVLHPDQLPQTFWRAPNAGIVVSTYGAQDRVAQILLDKGVPEDAIIKLYEYTHTY